MKEIKSRLIVACRKSSRLFSDILNIKYTIWDMFDSFWSLWWMFTRNHWPLPHLKWNKIGSFPEKAKTDSGVQYLIQVPCTPFILPAQVKQIFFTVWWETTTVSCTVSLLMWKYKDSELVGKLTTLFFFLSLHFIQSPFSFSMQELGKTHPKSLFILKAFCLLNMVLWDLPLFLTLFETGISYRSQSSAVKMPEHNTWKDSYESP